MYSSKATLISITIALACSDVHVAIAVVVGTLDTSPPLLHPERSRAKPKDTKTATLPITMSNLEKRAGVEPRIGNFVLPLGATINMDGTALYESVAVIFIAQLLGVHLTMGMQIVIFITASLAAVGAAAIPGAGLVTMGIVLTAAGLPLDGIGLILAIDRILDQFRTAINVWGDATAAVVVGRGENAIH
jgi:Na+/H+-dicarboxylate symporter